jgi:GT2 family glycosyltransferase
MITIIYAYRNRELARVKASLDSLALQTNTNFEVCLVDYGSEINLANEMKELVMSYSFAQYFYLDTAKLLWNKSKALNFGIKKASNEYIFIADVDIIFSPDTVDFLIKNSKPTIVYLFRLNYFSKKESQKLYQSYKFEDLVVSHSGNVNGLVLASKTAFYKVNGFDEFFHFYGSEDVDLYERLSNAGFEIAQHKESLFYHNWHPIYNSYDDSKMSLTPRIFNIKRINQQQYFFHQKNKSIIPDKQEQWGEEVNKKMISELEHTELEFHLNNVQAEIIHFFEIALTTFKSEVVKIEIIEVSSMVIWKNRLKKWMGKTYIPIMSIKECNDLILSKIVYQYRNHYYSYVIDPSFKKLTLIIKL